MLQQQTVSESKGGGNIRPLNCGVMKLRFCLLPVSMHAGIECYARFKMQNHLFKLGAAFWLPLREGNTER